VREAGPFFFPSSCKCITRTPVCGSCQSIATFPSSEILFFRIPFSSFRLDDPPAPPPSSFYIATPCSITDSLLCISDLPSFPFSFLSPFVLKLKVREGSFLRYLFGLCLARALSLYGFFSVYPDPFPPDGKSSSLSQDLKILSSLNAPREYNFLKEFPDSHHH